MTVLIGPDTGDVAPRAKAWARFERSEMGMPVPALVADSVEFPNCADFGLVRAAENPSNKWATLDTLCADLSSKYEVDLYDIRGMPDTRAWDESAAKKIAGAVFPDQHSPQWWAEVHETGRIMLLIGPFQEFTEPGNRLSENFLSRALIGLCPLVVKAYRDGIGTRPGT